MERFKNVSLFIFIVIGQGSLWKSKESQRRVFEPVCATFAFAFFQRTIFLKRKFHVPAFFFENLVRWLLPGMISYKERSSCPPRKLSVKIVGKEHFS